MASSGLNEESVEKKLLSVTNTQDSIQGLSLWIIHHKVHHARIVELWYKVMKKSVKPSHRLTLFYLCNDVVQTGKRKKATVFIDTFRPLLRHATPLVRDATIRPKVERIFNIWEERQVFDKDFVAELKGILDGKKVDDVLFKKPHSHRDKLKQKAMEKVKELKMEKAANSPVKDDFDPTQPVDAVLALKNKEKETVEYDAPSEEVLAAFKPPEMIERIRTFKHQEAEVEIKVRQLSHLKLDASSIEAIKQLKDRAHGNEFSTQFEESCQRLEEAVKGLEKKNEEQKELMALLRVSEYFYDQQYREARIVANAYKSYGSHINTKKKKLDELIRSLPSQVPSPSMDAPSPGNTPPLLDDSISHAGSKNLEVINSQNAGEGEDDDMPSPPDEAPSPVGSSPGDTPTQMKGSSSLENRLASFIPSLQSASSTGPVQEERPIPVYVPQPLNSNGSISARRPSANKTLTEPEIPFLEDDDGGATPLTDEQPSTPVMDEEPGNSSPPPPPPPEKKKKENPIDFLTRLISQSQKSKLASSGGNSFLENFCMLSSRVKESLETTKGADIEDSNMVDSVGPKSWAAWKAEKAAEGDDRVDQSDMSIPPPMIPSFGVSLPASIASPVPSLVMSPVMPMPVPPPALTSSTSSFYQHTSPGQKENWPEVMDDVGDSGDMVPSPNIVYPPVQNEMSLPPFPPVSSKPVSAMPMKSILRKTSNSVLKELTPSIEDASASDPVLAPPPPPPLPPISIQTPLSDGNAIATLGSGSHNEAQEFMEKLKRKTSVGSSTPAYTPNPIRPNLMTLTPGGEMDMDLDEEEEEEEEEEDEVTRIPVLSSVVRRVDPVEQLQAREKEIQHLRDMDLVKAPRDFTPAPPQKGDTFHRERHYSRENPRDSFYPPFASAVAPRFNRSFGYGSEEPGPFYPPYSQNMPNFYGEGNFSSYSYRPSFPKRPFHKHGNQPRGNRRNYHY